MSVVDGRVASVETTSGAIETDMVVAAAGPQTGLLADMVGAHVPVAPARVEMLATAPLEPLFDIALVGNGLYGRQAARGNLLFGGGAHEWIDVGLTDDPDKPNTPLIRNIARRLAELLPGVSDVPLLRSWAGVVEQAPDYLPIIDLPDSPSNYVVVTASAHGFGLTPATGRVVSDLALYGESSVDISGLSLSRFADVRAELAGGAWLDSSPLEALRPRKAPYPKNGERRGRRRLPLDRSCPSVRPGTPGGTRTHAPGSGGQCSIR